mgnify:CR=1 FL=1
MSSAIVCNFQAAKAAVHAERDCRAQGAAKLKARFAAAIHNNAFQFLQTFTTIRNGTLDIQFYHKNTHRQAQSQTLLKNVVPFDSHWPTHIHTGRVLGALHSIAHHVNSNASVLKGTMELMHEFKQQGMSNNMIKNTLHIAQKQTRCAAFGVAQTLLEKPKR